MVLGQSGYGKSTSLGNIPELNIQGLDPKETVLINPRGKMLPFRSGEYKPLDSTHLDGNHVVTLDYEVIQKAIKHINDNRKEIKNVVLDDTQYLMAHFFMNMHGRKGNVFDHYNKLATDIYTLLDSGLKMRDDINFIVLSHSEETKESYKMKTIGKMFDQYCTPEGMFSVVLYITTKSEGGKVRHLFVTNNDGNFPAKSPVGMFKDIYIPNDMGYVINKIKEYYE